MTPRENYLKVLRGETPEFVPSFYEPFTDTIWLDYYVKPSYAPDGFNFSPWGVRYVGSKDLNFGGIPEPNFIILRDIRQWRDVIKNPDVRDVDFERYYNKSLEGRDRENLALIAVGGEYFQTLVSFMGFSEALMAMHEEPEEVYALLDYISEYSMGIARQKIRYTKPDIYMVSDDCAAAKAPFFSLDMYKRLIKPFHAKHAALAIEHGIAVTKHDCGKSEQFIDDWLDIGISGWNPAQPMNDLPAIKRKYGARLTIDGGCWDYITAGRDLSDDDALIAAVDEYVATFAPGGGFIFAAMPPFDPANMEDFGRRNELVRKYFFDKIRNYYN